MSKKFNKKELKKMNKSISGGVTANYKPMKTLKSIVTDAKVGSKVLGSTAKKAEPIAASIIITRETKK